MHWIRPRPAALLAFVVLCLVAAACGGASETTSANEDVAGSALSFVEDTTTTTEAVALDSVVVAARGSIDASPVWVADSEGFFATGNLDITFAAVSDELSTFDAVRNGEAQVAIVSASAAIRRVSFNDDELEFISYVDGTQGGLGEARGTMSLISQDSTLTEGCSLEWKRVGVDSLFALTAVAVREMVDSDGCDSSRVSFVPGDSPTHLEALGDGRLDAVAVLDPYTSRAVRNENVITANLDNQLCPDYGRCPITIAVADRTWAEANPEMVERFQSALDNAMFWIRQNELAYRAELVSCCALTADDAADVRVPNFVGERRALEADLERLLDIMVGQGQVESTRLADALTR